MEELGKYGPAMLALPNQKWRDTAIAFIEGGGASRGRGDKGYISAIRAAGWTGTPMSLQVTASRLFSDGRMQAAIQEEARKRTVTLLPMAIAAHTEIMNDKDHKDRLAAARSVMDRAGLHAVTEERKVLEISFGPEQIKRAVMLAKRMNIPLAQLVGPRAAALATPEGVELEGAQEAEFEEVADE
jgi:hypothetical protein